MFAVDPHYLKCTVYLYPSRQDAEDGTRVGGSGFTVSVPSRHDGRQYLYVATNRHVVNEGNRFVRFVMKDGDAGIMETQPEEWVVSVDDDLAVVDSPLPKEVDWVAIGTDIFLNDDCMIEGWQVSPGDEVFFYGRFIEHDGRQRNKPVMRFGNIAMLADESTPVQMGTHQQTAFLVECRSLSGSSGSPAFVKLATTRLTHGAEQPKGLIPGNAVKLLGVDSGHFPFWSRVRDKPNLQSAIHQDMFVETNSGIAVIVPAWKLTQLLNQDPLKARREKTEQQLDQEPSVSVMRENGHIAGNGD